MSDVAALEHESRQRVLSLSDGVFAIAMTLLAFDVQAPAAITPTWDGIADALAPTLSSFFWSFFATAIFWLTHRRSFASIARLDRGLVVINLVLLGEITLIPIANRTVVPLGLARAPLELYLGLFGVIGATNAVLWVYAAVSGLLRPGVAGPVTVGVMAMFQLVVPVAMTSLGVLSQLPDRGWLPLLMPAIAGATVLLGRAARTMDRRRGALVWAARGSGV